MALNRCRIGGMACFLFMEKQRYVFNLAFFSSGLTLVLISSSRWETLEVSFWCYPERAMVSTCIPLGTVFENLHFGCPKTPFRLKRGKKSPFPKCPDTYRWGLRFEIQQEKGENRFMVSEKGTTVAQWEILKRKRVLPTLRFKWTTFLSCMNRKASRICLT